MDVLACPCGGRSAHRGTFGDPRRGLFPDPAVRAMFGAGRFREVVRQAGPIDEGENAPLDDVFFVGRSHEELHRRLTAQSQAAEPADATRATATAAAAAKIRAAKHLERAHDIYARIESRDVSRFRHGKPVPGSRRAVRVARSLIIRGETCRVVRSASCRAWTESPSRPCPRRP